MSARASPFARRRARNRALSQYPLPRARTSSPHPLCERALPLYINYYYIPLHLGARITSPLRARAHHFTPCARASIIEHHFTPCARAHGPYSTPPLARARMHHTTHPKQSSRNSAARRRGACEHLGQPACHAIASRRVRLTPEDHSGWSEGSGTLCCCSSRCSSTLDSSSSPFETISFFGWRDAAVPLFRHLLMKDARHRRMPTPMMPPMAPPTIAALVKQ